jgi:hypothetical protein
VNNVLANDSWITWRSSGAGPGGWRGRGHTTLLALAGHDLSGVPRLEGNAVGSRSGWSFGVGAPLLLLHWSGPARPFRSRERPPDMILSAQLALLCLLLGFGPASAGQSVLGGPSALSISPAGRSSSSKVLLTPSWSRTAGARCSSPRAGLWSPVRPGRSARSFLPCTGTTCLASSSSLRPTSRAGASRW